MDILLTYLIAPLFFFWWQILVGMTTTGFLVWWLQRNVNPSPLRLQLEGVVALLSAFVLWISCADGVTGGHLPDVPALGAALDLALLNLLLLFVTDRLGRKQPSVHSVGAAK